MKRLTLSDIQQLTIKDIEQMSRSEFSRTVSDLNAIAKKRIKNIEKAGFKSSPAVNMLEFQGGIKPLKGLTKNELLAQFNRTRAFINNSTSKVKGVRKFQKQTEEQFGYSDILTMDEVWEIYDEVVKINPNLGLYYTETVEDIIEMNFNSKGDINEIVRILTDKNVKRYERSVENDDFLPPKFNPN